MLMYIYYCKIACRKSYRAFRIDHEIYSGLNWLASRTKEIFDDVKVNLNVCFLQIFIVPRSQLNFLLPYAGK